MTRQILSPERNLMLSKTYSIRPISGQVVLFLDNETWKIFKIALSKLFVTVFNNILRTNEHLRNFLGGNSTAFNYDFFHFSLKFF